jgi:hypothetical protein
MSSINKKVERLRAVETTAQQVSALVVNLSALGDFNEADLELMESFKSIFHLGTNQLDKFVDLLDEKGKDVDDYTIYYYINQLRQSPLKFFVSQLVDSNGGKKYWKLSPDIMGCLGNRNLSQVNIPLFTADIPDVNVNSKTKLPEFMLTNINDSNSVCNNIQALAFTGLLELDEGEASKRFDLEPQGTYNKTPHGSYSVSDVETKITNQELTDPIEQEVITYLGEDDYRLYLLKKGFNPYSNTLNNNKTTNIKVQRIISPDIVIETDLIGNTFETDEARAFTINVITADKNIKASLHTVDGQLGSAQPIKREPITLQ